MKKILFLLLIPLKLFSQESPKTSLPLDSISQKIDYKIIELTPGLSQKQLYANAKEWVAKNFNSAQNVIQMDDAVIGKIIIKAFTPYYAYKKKERYDYKLWFILSITVKDEKYKFELTDMERQEKGESEKYAAELFIKPSLKDLGWLDITTTIENLWKDFEYSIRIAMKKKDDF